MKQLEKQGSHTRKYNLWYKLRKGQHARRNGKFLLVHLSYLVTHEEIVPPVEMKQLIWSNMDSVCVHFAVQMVRSLDEQLDTVAKEALIQYVIESLTLREWNMVKGQLQHNDTRAAYQKVAS